MCVDLGIHGLFDGIEAMKAVGHGGGEAVMCPNTVLYLHLVGSQCP